MATTLNPRFESYLDRRSEANRTGRDAPYVFLIAARMRVTPAFLADEARFAIVAALHDVHGSAIKQDLAPLPHVFLNRS
jgi:hypothetical protein